MKFATKAPKKEDCEIFAKTQSCEGCQYFSEVLTEKINNTDYSDKFNNFVTGLPDVPYCERGYK